MACNSNLTNMKSKNKDKYYTSQYVEGLNQMPKFLGNSIISVLPRSKATEGGILENSRHLPGYSHS